MPYPDFSDQVYELLDVARNIRESLPVVARAHVQIVWVVPRDTAPEAAPFGVPMEMLFGFPVESADVDRPSLVIRPARPPEPGPNLIKPPMSQVMRDYDRGADLLFGREL